MTELEPFRTNRQSAILKIRDLLFNENQILPLLPDTLRMLWRSCVFIKFAIFAGIVKKLLKYLLLSLVALAFHMGAKDDLFAHEDIQDYDCASAYAASLNVSITAPTTDICIPRQASTVSVPRLQSNSNRHETSHRQNHEVVKSGKAINTILGYVVQKQSLIIHSSLMEPANKLVSLCRLII